MAELPLPVAAERVCPTIRLRISALLAFGRQKLSSLSFQQFPQKNAEFHPSDEDDDEDDDEDEDDCALSDHAVFFYRNQTNVEH